MCRLQEANFTNADLTGTIFQDCDLTNTVFQGIILTGADLSTATDLRLNPEVTTLTGAQFALASLPGLLEKYGIAVV